MDDMHVPERLRGLPHIVVLGAGFAGLTFAREFRGNARITIVDRQNHHLFQPLLYQVAMAALSAPEIAEPVRGIFRNQDRVMSLMDEVRSIDLKKRTVQCADFALKYDYLVCGMGGVKSFFGNDAWEKHAMPLKSLSDAMRMRRHLLSSFERAETVEDVQEQRRLLTIVVVGGGATGVELAGSMAELCRVVFKRDFRRIDPTTARVVLVHSRDRVLEEYPADLSEKARLQLQSLGVEIIFNDRVVDVQESHVQLKGGGMIETRNVLWAAGVAGNPVSKSLGIELDRGGRVPVDKDLSIASRGYPEVFFVGDIAAISDAKGQPVPGVAPAAMQMGRHVAKLVSRRLERQIASNDSAETTEPFEYWDKGMMATIGRKRAVAWTGDIFLMRGWKLSGLLAWFAWLFVHIAYLIGFRNKVSVLLSWVYAYVSFRRGARIILEPERTGIFSPTKGVPAEAPGVGVSAGP